MFSNILIIGSGTMGLGIASLFLTKNFNVTVAVREQACISTISDKMRKMLTRACRKNELKVEPEVLLSNAKFSVSVAADTRFDLVIEAVSEDIEIKKAVICKYQHLTDKNTIWATNTSSLSVTDLSAVYKYPNQFIGLHFFNPVASMELVELVPSMLTEEKIVKKCWRFCCELEKKPVRVEDNPGFIVNRLLIPMINEAVGLLENKVANVEEIDSAMKLGAHHPLGPLALADLIGNDVCLSIMNALFASTCDSKYRPCYLLQKMVSANKLGRKTGVGFYNY